MTTPRSSHEPNGRQASTPTVREPDLAVPVRDPILWLLGVVFLGSAAVLVWPGLDPDMVGTYTEYYGMLPLLAAAILATRWDTAALPNAAERTFWGLIAAGLGFHLVVVLFYLTPLSGMEQSKFAADVGYVLFYFAILRALATRPDRGAAPGGPLARVEALATGVFLAGLFVYFIVVPEAVSSEAYNTWIPSLMLYATLDAYLVLYLVYLHLTSESAGWRVTYGWLTVVFAVLALVDTWEGFLHVGWADPISQQSLLNVFWFAPYTGLGFVARLRIRSATGVGDGSQRPGPAGAGADARIGFIVLYSVVLPVLHLTSNLLGILDEESNGAREITVLVFLPVLLGLAFVHQRLLEGRARRLEEKGRVLEEQQVLLTAAVEQDTNAVIVADADGDVVYANPAWERVAGRGRDEVMAMSVEDVLADLGETAVASFRGARAEGSGSARISRQGRDGTTMEEELAVSPVENAEGVLTHFAISLRDVTRESSLEQQVQHGQRMEALGTLAGGIAHDFNNMLAAILGYSELLLSASETEATARADIEQILKAAERAKGLTGQILTFSRRDEVVPRPVFLGAVVEDVLQLARSTIPSSISVQTDVDVDCGLILADEGRIHQVALNLITNAAHAVGEKGTITVGVAEIMREDRCAMLMVADDGVGMSRETRDRIFDPFFTTKAAGEGTGMGLSVVHGIVTGLGGGIDVESEEGRGTTFRVYLPLAEEAVFEPVAHTAEASADHRRLRVLLVDDEEMVGKVHASLLTTRGFDVEVADDAQTALRVFGRGPEAFDVVVTDQTMPGLTGIELATAIHRVRPDLPVILLTGFSKSTTAERLAEAGIAEVMLKPVTRGELVAAIQRHCLTPVG